MKHHRCHHFSVSFRIALLGGAVFLPGFFNIASAQTATDTSSNTQTFSPAAGESISYTDVISDNENSPVSVIHDGAGTTTLSGVNTYTGVTTIKNDGTLILTGNGSIAASSQVDFDNGTLDISGTNNGATVKSISGNQGTVNLGDKYLTLLNADSDAYSTQFTGTTGGLTIAGGKMIMDKNYTYTGDTIIQKDASLQLGGSLQGDLVNDGTAQVSGRTDGGTASDPLHFVPGYAVIYGKTTNSGTLTATGATFGDINNTGGSVEIKASTAGKITNASGATFTAQGMTILYDGNTTIINTTFDSVENKGDMTLRAQAYVKGDAHQKEGTLTLDNGHINGTLYAEGGTFTVTNNSAFIDSLSGSGDGLLNGGILDLKNADGNDNYSGSISGNGTVLIEKGLQTLSGQNTYTGATNVMGSLTLTGSVAGTVNNHGTTNIVGGTVGKDVDNIYYPDYTIYGILTLSENATINGTLEVDDYREVKDSTFRVTDTNATAGTLIGNANGTLDGTLTLDNASTAYSGSMSGKGGLTITGGNETLTGNNSYTDDTVIKEDGALTLDGATLSGTLDVQQGGSFNITQGISGNASIIGSLTGSGNGTLKSVLYLQNANDTYSGSMSGYGGLIVAGGKETLTGNNSYQAGTIVGNGAELDVNGDNSAATGMTSVVGNSTLRGNGTIGGDVSIASGSTIAAGTSDNVGTLNINGNLTLAQGSHQNFRVGQAGVTGGDYNDYIHVAGNLSLGGQITLQPNENGPDTSTTGLDAGIYHLYGYEGSLTLNDPTLVIQNSPGSPLSLQTSINHEVNAIVGNQGGMAFWDGDNAGNRTPDGQSPDLIIGNNKVDGGDGIWSTSSVGTTPNWTSSNGAINGLWTDGAMAVFEGTAGTVHVNSTADASVTFSSMQFANNDGGTYVIKDDPLYATQSDTTIRVGDGTTAGQAITAEIDSVIDGSHVDGGISLHKTDAGTLILGADNNFAKPTTIEGGTLQLGNGGTTGSLGNQAIVNNGTLAINHSNDVTLKQIISGSGGFIQEGTGTTTLTGQNSYTGDTLVQNGTLKLDGATLASTLDVQGGRFDVTSDNAAAASLTGSGNGTVGGTLTLNNAKDTYSGSMSGNGGLTVAGGTETLSGNNSYTGNTTVSKDAALTLDGSTLSGTLDAQQGGSFDVTTANAATASLTGSGNGTVEGTLTLNNAKDTYAGSMSGNGALTIAGGTETLSGNNHYQGATTVSKDAVLNLTGSLDHDLKNDGKANINSGTIGGTTTNTGTLTAENASLHNVVNNSGSATLDNSNAGAITNASEAAFTTTGGSIASAENSGTMTVGKNTHVTGNITQKGSTLTLDGSTINGTLDAQGGAFNITDSGSAVGSLTGSGNGTVEGTLTLNKANDTYAGTMSGGGGLTIAGGTETLTGNNSYAGETTVSKDAELVVNGDDHAATGHTSVNGTLHGNGTIGGNVSIASGGTLGAGTNNAMGTLHINGDLTMDQGSVLNIRGSADKTGNQLPQAGGYNPAELSSDRVIVGGKASLQGGTLNLQVSNPTGLTYGEAYRVMTAANGVSGKYDTLQTNLGSQYAYLDPTLVYSQDYVDIVLERGNNSFASAGGTRNQITTGEGLDHISASSELAQAMVGLTHDQARKALDNLSGEVHASIRTALIQDSFFIRNAALNRLANSDCDAGGAGQSVYDMKTHQKNGACSSDHVIMWGQAYGSIGHNSGTGNAATMHDRTTGFIMGVDTPIHNSNWRVGGLFSYGHSMFDIGQGRSSSGNSDNVTVGGYAGTHWGRLNLRLGVAYSWNVINARRDVRVGAYGNKLTSHYLGGTAQSFAELGYKMHMGRSVVEPFMNVAYVNMQTNGYTEHNGNAALRGAGNDNGVTFSTFGVRASTRFNIGKMLFMPHFTAAYRHAFGNLESTQREAFAMAGGRNDMDIAGVKLSSNTAIIDTGISARLTDLIDIDLSYIGQYGDQSTDSGATGSIKVHF